MQHHRSACISLPTWPALLQECLIWDETGDAIRRPHGSEESHTTHKFIAHAEELTWYTPPGHVGTSNTRLVGRDFCGSFEMLRRVVQPGREAEPHQHEHEYQVIYVLQGTAEVTLGDAPPECCKAGSIIRIPPRLMHRIVSLGPEPYEAIVIYSPPLPARSDTPQA